jgi:hypothetical protein
MAEAVEQVHLDLCVAAHLVILREVEHELLDPRAQLVGEVRSGGPDERVDVGGGRLGHCGKAYWVGSERCVARSSPI